MKAIIYGIIDRKDDSLLITTIDENKKNVDDDCKLRQTEDRRYYVAKFGLNQIKFKKGNKK